MSREKVRLVIWDLDETFWPGTVTEGGHCYSRESHHIVVELARRGIISSVCSKNDMSQIRSIFQAEGLWDYFAFPSINWEAKGPRIARLIEDMQLRPASVLFIDDNPLNRSEAAYFVPGLQVEDEHCISGLLDNPLLAGKHDPDLSRLKQYKLLETRKIEEVAAGGDNVSFLRQSGITVTLDYDLVTNLDRAVELVNRTNQLNFTKARLSENVDAARAELLELVGNYDIQAGLVHVKDNYGDYGYCGFFAVRVGALSSRLKHFCFSCRILNMGVEAWVFDKLGRPDITVVGEVLTDIRPAALEVPDWINAEVDPTISKVAAGVRVNQVIAFGPCNLSSVARYFLVAGAQVTTEVPSARHGMPIVRNHSLFLRYAALGVPEAEHAELLEMGFLPEDWSSALLQPQMEKPVWLLCFADSNARLYQHKKLDLALPVAMKFLPDGSNDLLQADPMLLPENMRTAWACRVVEKLRHEYTWGARIDQIAFAANIKLLMDRAPSDALIFVFLENQVTFDAQGMRKPVPWKQDANGRLREVFSAYPSVEFIDSMDFVYSRDEVDQNPNHFNREVYYRIYKHILERIAAKSAQQAEPVALGVA